MLYPRYRVVGKQPFEPGVEIIFRDTSVSQNLLCESVIALSCLTVQPLDILRIHVAENVLTTDCRCVIVTFPLGTQKVVALNPLDFIGIGELVAVQNVHFLPGFEVVYR